MHINQQYFSQKSQGGAAAPQQEDYDMSSALSSVKLTDEYSTERSIAPAMIDKMAGLMNMKEKFSDHFSSNHSAVQPTDADNDASDIEQRLRYESDDLKQVIKACKQKDSKYSIGARAGMVFNKFTIAYIMCSIDVNKLKVLKDRFELKQKVQEDGFGLDEFVMLMKKVIMYEHPVEETDLVHGLITLFNEIDIDGNGFMEWDEFTGFLIEAVDQKQLTQGRLANDEIVSGNEYALEVLRMEESQPDYKHTNNMLQVARSQIYQKFNLSNTFKDKLVRNTAIVSATLYHATDSFITLEHQAKSVKFISAMSNQAIPGIASKTRQTTKVNEQINLPASGSNYILSVAFNEEDKIVALCATDGMMYFYRRYGNQSDWKLFKIICSHGIVCQVSIWYMPHHKRWFTIGSQQQGNYSRKNVKVGQVLTLHQWDIPRSKWLSNKQMMCQTCQDVWTRSRERQDKSGGSSVYDHVIEKPFVELYSETGERKMSPDLRYLVEPFEHMAHRDDVKDLKEIYHPFLAIITACHDGKLRIIDTQSMRRVIGILHSGHTTGIRQIDYTPYHGAAIISTGYESFFNLWEIDNSVSFAKQMKDMATKFSLVSHPCIAARFLGRSVFCAAVDSQFLVKIWNYKKREMMQSLQLNSLRLQDTISGMMIFSEGKFAVLSKHITFYDNLINKMAEVDAPNRVMKKKDLEMRRLILQERGLSEIKQAANQQRNCMINPPIDVVFLESYQNFLVLTKDSLRVYNGKNGRLCMYLDNICEKDEFTGLAQDLSAMCLNAEHRIVFVGDIQGKVRCYNVNTGLLIQKLYVDSAMLYRQGELNAKVNREIAQMQFVQVSEEHHFLVFAQWNSRIRIWDVGDMQQASHLRTASAQKVFSEDIRCVAVSEHLSLIVTGSMLGKIVIWDQELLRCEGVMIGAKGAIVALQFIDKFPMLVSAGACGTISVFAVRGCPTLLRQHCLGRFLNLAPNPKSAEKIVVNTAITAMTCEVVANPRYDRHERTPRSELAANMRYFADQRDNYRKGDSDRDVNWCSKSVFLARQDVDFTEYNVCFNEKSPLQPKKPDPTKTVPEKHTKVGKKATAADDKQQKEKAEVKDPEEGKFNVADQDALCKKFYPPFNNNENPEFLNVVITDESGCIKWLDLTTFIRQPLQPIENDQEQSKLQSNPAAPVSPYLERCRPYADSKVGFMPSRRMETEAGSVAISFLELTKRRVEPKLVLSCRSVQIKTIANAHKGRINNIRRINVPPYGFVTCGNDKYVRVWSKWGQRVGEINLIKENTKLKEWRFGYNWAQKKRSEQRKALDIVRRLNMGTIDEANTEYHSGQSQNDDNTFVTQKRKGKDYKMSFSRPALDQLVENADTKTLKSYKGGEMTGVRQSRRSIGEKSDAQNSIFQIENMFPVPQKQDHFRDPKESLLVNRIDMIMKARQKQNSAEVNKRFSQSQGGNRTLKHDRSAQDQNQNVVQPGLNMHQPRSSIKNTSSMGVRKTTVDRLKASRISFQGDPVGSPQTQSSHSASTGSAYRVNSAESKSSDSGIGDVPDSVFEKGVFHSRADIKLAKKIEQINSDENPRSAIFFKKIPLRSGGESGKSSQSNNHRSNLSSKSFKALESKHEQVTQRSDHNTTTLKEFTASSAANREKWQPKIMTKVKTHKNLATVENLTNPTQDATPQSLSRQRTIIFKKERVSTLTKNTSKNDQVTYAEDNQINKDLLLESLKRKKSQVLKAVNEKSNQHLKQMIEECQTRHNQMKKYIEQRSKPEEASPNVHDFSNELQDIMVGNAANMTAGMKRQQQDELRVDKQKSNVSMRPPKAQKNLRQIKQQAAKLQSAAIANKKTRFLKRIDAYINEQNSDVALDQRFMMRHSQSVDRLSRNAINNSSNLQDHRASAPLQQSDAAGGDSRRSTEMKEVREMQKRIARHISHKAFSRQGSIGNLNENVREQLVGSGALTSRETQQTEQAQNQISLRQSHLMKGNGTKGSTVKNFIAKQNQKRHQVADKLSSFEEAELPLPKKV